jgi:hypothetical protein
VIFLKINMNLIMTNFKICLLALLLVSGACRKSLTNDIVESDHTPPSVVTNVTVKNGNGAATITYTLPNDPDLLYIKAVYTTVSGVSREVKSSYYNNNLVVDGFADTLPHTISLYAVNRSEAASSPVTVTIHPLIAPIWLVFDSLKVAATYGGVRIRSVNQLRGDVVIVPLVDSLNNGQWEPLDNVYTSDSIIATSIRGMQPVASKLAFFVRDRWLNHTDTLFATITPKIEVPLDETKFFVFRSDNDAQMSYSTTVDLMWTNTYANQWPCVNTDISSGVPAVITWGLGQQPVKLTRFNILTRPQGSASNLYFTDGSPRLFEVYGSNDPTRDGDWSKWTKILSCQVVKPSGLPLGTETSADLASGKAGFTFDFDEDTPPYQYLRIKCLQNWNNSYFIVIEQLFMWGTN